MPITFASVLAGLAGGVLRGTVGIYKTQTVDKLKFNLKYFSLTMAISALVGAVAGALANQNWQIAFLAGYAGTDFLEGLYKSKFAQFFKLS